MKMAEFLGFSAAQCLRMTRAKNPTPFYARPVYRWLSGAFGCFLLFAAAYIFMFAETSTAMRWAVSAVFLLLGGNTVSSALKAREPWISKIGPLPF